MQVQSPASETPLDRVEASNKDRTGSALVVSDAEAIVWFTSKPVSRKSDPNHADWPLSQQAPLRPACDYRRRRNLCVLTRAYCKPIDARRSVLCKEVP
ncbi:hypothetical protein Q5P01_016659 [Channa striata]|uniref:Uncharacterized protein n=1 Tax=Channa striata TaxID=64152 RepID=A0AA88M821_CHASR|nr:hypothetical protein Q5P01_016659 [Channa striata]